MAEAAGDPVYSERAGLRILPGLRRAGQRDGGWRGRTKVIEGDRGFSGFGPGASGMLRIGLIGGNLEASRKPWSAMDRRPSPDSPFLVQ